MQVWLIYPLYIKLVDNYQNNGYIYAI